jgi:hypothetical protein
MGNEYKNGRMTEYKDLDIFFFNEVSQSGPLSEISVTTLEGIVLRYVGPVPANASVASRVMKKIHNNWYLSQSKFDLASLRQNIQEFSQKINEFTKSRIQFNEIMLCTLLVEIYMTKGNSWTEFQSLLDNIAYTAIDAVKLKDVIKDLDCDNHRLFVARHNLNKYIYVPAGYQYRLEDQANFHCISLDWLGWWWPKENGHLLTHFTCTVHDRSPYERFSDVVIKEMKNQDYFLRQDFLNTYKRCHTCIYDPVELRWIVTTGGHVVQECLCIYKTAVKNHSGLYKKIYNHYQDN